MKLKKIITWFEPIDRFPTRITSNTSTLINHILGNTHGNISQSGLIDTGISDDSLIYYCTRKILKAKRNRQQEITFHALKNYTADV